MDVEVAIQIRIEICKNVTQRQRSESDDNLFSSSRIVALHFSHDCATNSSNNLISPTEVETRGVSSDSFSCLSVSMISMLGMEVMS